MNLKIKAKNIEWGQEYYTKSKQSSGILPYEEEFDIELKNGIYYGRDFVKLEARNFLQRKHEYTIIKADFDFDEVKAKKVKLLTKIEVFIEDECTFIEDTPDDKLTKALEDIYFARFVREIDQDTYEDSMEYVLEKGKISSEIVSVTKVEDNNLY